MRRMYLYQTFDFLALEKLKEMQNRPIKYSYK